MGCAMPTGRKPARRGRMSYKDLRKLSPQTKTFEVVLSKQEGVPLGAAIKRMEGYSLITAISAHGKIKDWNDDHPDQEIQPGDRIVAVNGNFADHWSMVQELWHVGQFSLTLERDLREEREIRRTNSRIFLADLDGHHKYLTMKLTCPVDGLPHVYAGDCSVGECAVCLEEYTDLQTRLVMLPCNHAFHPACAARWFSQGKSRCCPLCKQDVDGHNAPECKQSVEGLNAQD